jgi:ABC-type sugar transport system ATPase subunit
VDELIRVEHVNKRYDGAWALRDASFSAVAGEVHALMGENGAGKSTLSKILAGAVNPDSGEFYWQGQPVRINSPADAQRLGIGIVFQELDLFPHLSIAENIVIGNRKVERNLWVRSKQLLEFCRPFLNEVGLKENPGKLLGDLPIGHMQLVAIARALSFQARLILMDEPTSSLSEDAVDRLFHLLRRLKANGITIVYVSHKMKEVFDIADRVTVLRDGATIGSSRMEDTNPSEVITMMVGRKLTSALRAPARQTGEVVLDVRGVSTTKLRDVSFTVSRGEILGIAGLVGSGRSEVGAALFGLDRVNSGVIRLRGAEIRPGSPREAVRLGLGLLAEDRKLQGLMMRMSVLENTTMAVLSRFQRYGFLSRDAEAAAAAPVHRSLSLKAASDRASVSSLSGGNQQKVLLSKWLLTDPAVLFLDEPTRGIDVGAKQDIYDVIEGLAAGGKAVIFVSSELPELLRCCDRILVMRDGRAMGILDGRSATQEQIMSLASAGEAAA